MAMFIVSFKSGRAHQVEATEFKSSDDSLWIDFLDQDKTVVFRIAADLVSTVERLDENQ